MENSYSKKITDSFVNTIKNVATSKYFKKIDLSASQEYKEFLKKLQYFSFLVEDEIYTALKKNGHFIFNTNFDKSFDQNERRSFSLSGIMEAHFIDVFNTSFNTVLGPNMNLVVFGNKQLTKTFLEGYVNGKKQTFGEATILSRDIEQTK